MFNFQYNNIDIAHKLDVASYPEDDYGKHMHYFYEILYFVKGDVTYTVETESHRLQEGELIVICPGKYHFAQVDRKTQYERYVMKFPESVVPEHLRKVLKKKGAFFGNQKKFFSVFDRFDSYAENYSDDDLYTLFVSEIARMLVVLCKEQSFEHGQKNAVIARLVDYIDENIYQPVSLQTIARDFNFSESYISNEFKKYMKIPIMQYVRYKKIILAHQMILSGEKKTDVSEKLGFENYSTFYRNYVKIIGSTETTQGSN